MDISASDIEFLRLWLYINHSKATPCREHLEMDRIGLLSPLMEVLYFNSLFRPLVSFVSLFLSLQYVAQLSRSNIVAAHYHVGKHRFLDERV